MVRGLRSVDEKGGASARRAPVKESDLPGSLVALRDVVVADPDILMVDLQSDIEPLIAHER